MSRACFGGFLRTLGEANPLNDEYRKVLRTYAFPAFSRQTLRYSTTYAVYGLPPLPAGRQAFLMFSLKGIQMPLFSIVGKWVVFVDNRWICSTETTRYRIFFSLRGI